MYDRKDLTRGLRNPSLLLTEARRLALRVNAAYSRLHRRADVCDVLEEDWDNLIILDGCRYDLFDRVNTISGRLESRISAGSESWGFLRANFQGRAAHDTVYVTANPHAHKLRDDTFYRTIDLIGERWDEDLRTVPPESVTDAAISAYDDLPDKRLIVHYMQPHFPFIGEVGREITHSGLTGDDPESVAEGENPPHVWYGLRDRTLDADESTVREAYRENLELTLPHVEHLLGAIDGMSVITADHGNLVGERTSPIPVKGYGHPPGFFASGLVKVPWFISGTTERRDVTDDPPVDDEEVADDIVADRLAALGYR